MFTKVQKWGNSQGLRFSKAILEEAHMEVGDEVKVSVQNGKIVVESSQRVRRRIKIEGLIAEMPPEYNIK
ncbi:transcriptional regulator/antitoxin, MazE [Candidatus Leptofilum sp.]|uniref:AbrB/MazE/SpoVT family DNA-binding domain-containing protein n=1 Tax=Candidatus Leptofilum sp. TaxID=3241576 RepID=UPI003B5AA281